jgi:hypothetical protein
MFVWEAPTQRYTLTIPCYQNLFSGGGIVEFGKPLPVLDDGRMVLWMRVFGTTIYIYNEVLWIYDPRTKTFMDGIKLSKCSVSLFVWSLLASGQRSAIDMAAESLLIGRQPQRSKAGRRHHKTEASLSTEGPNKKRRTRDLL